MKSKFANVALRTSLIYAGVAAVWILLSGRTLTALVSDPATRERLEIYKGWAFVAVTALLLYTLLRSQLRRLEEGGHRAQAGRREPCGRARRASGSGRGPTMAEFVAGLSRQHPHVYHVLSGFSGDPRGGLGHATLRGMRHRGSSFGGQKLNRGARNPIAPSKGRTRSRAGIRSMRSATGQFLIWVSGPARRGWQSVGLAGHHRAQTGRREPCP